MGSFNLSQIVKELLEIEKNPRKPTYLMASEIPLVLWDCNYDGDDGNKMQWNTDQEHTKQLFKQMYSSWKDLTIKGSVAKLALELIQPSTEQFTDENSQMLENIKAMLTTSESIAERSKYVPLMKRSKEGMMIAGDVVMRSTESLEEKQSRLSGGKKSKFEENKEKKRKNVEENKKE